MKISENVEAADVGQSVWRSSVSRNQLFVKRKMITFEKLGKESAGQEIMHRLDE